MKNNGLQVITDKHGTRLSYSWVDNKTQQTVVSAIMSPEMEADPIGICVFLTNFERQIYHHLKLKSQASESSSINGQPPETDQKSARRAEYSSREPR